MVTATKIHNSKLSIAILCALFGSLASAQEVQTYEFQPNQVYKIKTALGITTQIEISPREANQRL